MTGNNRFITREERLEAVQRYLEQGLVLTDQIRSAEMQWQVLTGRAFSLSSPGDLSAERVQTSPSPEASFADPLETRSELEEKLAHLIRSLRSLREQMIRIINHDTIGNENLILTCRPFSKLRVAVCVLMSVGFACAVAFLPNVFSLNVFEMTARHWIMLSAITAAGVFVLIFGTLLVTPILKKLESNR